MISELYKAALLWATSAACQSLLVNTTSGPVVGLINGTTPAVTQFLGVPFAEPPTGSLRFAPPVAVTKKNSTIDATQYPLACPQYESASKSVYSVDAREFLINRGATSEDCLKASIWVPSSAVPGAGTCSSGKTSDRGLPIIVWIYGGGFQTGGTNIGCKCFHSSGTHVEFAPSISSIGHIDISITCLEIPSKHDWDSCVDQHKLTRIYRSDPFELGPAITEAHCHLSPIPGEYFRIP